MSTTTTLFANNRTQAVRLPKDVAFSDHVRQVRILCDGPRRIIVPVDSLWDDFFDQAGIDFPDRDQQDEQVRDTL